MDFSKETQKTIRIMLKAVDKSKARLVDYLAGVRDGMGLSRDMRADLKKMRFEEPDAKED